MVDKVYTLAIHCRGKCRRLKNVDQDKYSYIDFLSDIREIHNVCDDELCGVDKGVNEGEYSEKKTEIEEEGEDSENEIEGSKKERGGSKNEIEGSEEVEGSENEELSQTKGTESGESESWDEKKSGEKSDETGDELNNYISDDHCESKNESDSDFEDDPLQGSLNRDARVLADDGVTFQIKSYMPNHTCVRSNATKEASVEWAIWGVLLAAIGLDGNNGLFPVAFVIAESECKESWGFFFENLSIMLSGFSYDKPWTFMSDRQKGLVETINEIVPNAVNMRCAKHMYANFRGQFAGATLKRHAFDERLKNDHITNNISESFNHWVGDLRSKPVLTLVDGLRTKLMCILQKRKLKGLKMSGDLVPNVVKELNKIKEESRKCHLLVAEEYEFEV
ncbi:hypothetical protein Sango_1616600 [Sesamum angolense]|uniref:MULE transposase domain-containing protein n=1 Tax=Sesamum angolense TaxID=2727404 RepID=A0AAE2BR82_9LAMI|nr:hypothetical protein Sango_1616600 [Sesamum angolense]